MEQAELDAQAGISVVGVTKSFGSTAALRGVDAVLPGEGLVLVEGENGSGKSTLLGVLGGLVRPSSGRVSFGRFGRSSEEVRCGMGWLSHELLAYRDLSGRRNLELAARLRGVCPEEAWLEGRERFGLGGFGERPVATYSRGQRQRLGLARALVGQPRLVLLDEPTTGLDAGGVEVLRSAVAGEVARGALVVIVSHEEAGFAGLGGRRLRLRRGRVDGWL